MNLLADRTPIEDETAEPPSDTDEPEISGDDDRAENEPTEPESFYGGGKKKKKTWWTDEYKEARQFFYGTKEMPPDFDAAFSLMQTEAQKGNGFAMHDLGKMYLSGFGCEKDEEQAQEWFRKAFSAFCAREPKEEKPGYLRYRIGKMYAFGYGVEQDYLKAAEWYEKSVAAGTPFAA